MIMGLGSRVSVFRALAMGSVEPHHCKFGSFFQAWEGLGFSVLSTSAGIVSSLEAFREAEFQAKGCRGTLNPWCKAP